MRTENPLDHFVGDRKRCGSSFHAEGSRGFEVDDELELRRLHDQQFSGIVALENTCAADSGLPISVRQVGAVMLASRCVLNEP